MTSRIENPIRHRQKAHAYQHYTIVIYQVQQARISLHQLSSHREDKCSIIHLLMFWAVTGFSVGKLYMTSTRHVQATTVEFTNQPTAPML